MSGDFCIFAVRFLNNDIMDKNKMTEENPAIDCTIALILEIFRIMGVIG